MKKLARLAFSFLSLSLGTPGISNAEPDQIKGLVQFCELVLRGGDPSDFSVSSQWAKLSESQRRQLWKFVNDQSWLLSPRNIQLAQNATFALALSSAANPEIPTSAFFASRLFELLYDAGIGWLFTGGVARELRILPSLNRDMNIVAWDVLSGNQSLQVRDQIIKAISANLKYGIPPSDLVLKMVKIVYLKMTIESREKTFVSPAVMEEFYLALEDFMERLRRDFPVRAIHLSNYLADALDEPQYSPRIRPEYRRAFNELSRVTRIFGITYVLFRKTSDE